MFKVRRIRVTLREDGEVLALLGAEVAGPRRLGAYILARSGMTPEAWAAGTWLKVDALTGPARGRLEKEGVLATTASE